MASMGIAGVKRYVSSTGRSPITFPAGEYLATTNVTFPLLADPMPRCVVLLQIIYTSVSTKRQPGQKGARRSPACNTHADNDPRNTAESPSQDQVRGGEETSSRAVMDGEYVIMGWDCEQGRMHLGYVC